MINLVVYQLGVTIKITGLNLLQAMPLCISYSRYTFYLSRTRNWYDQLSFESIETFNDVAVRNEYQIVKEQGGDVDQLLDKYRMENRDNSRTPMQWNDSTNGGFTEGKPWFPVNPNYRDINVAHQLEDEHSVLNFTKIDSIKEIS